MNEIILFKYLEGKATQEEKLQIHIWLQAAEGNRLYLAQLKAIWQSRCLASQAACNQRAEKSLAHLNARIDSLDSPQKPLYRIRNIYYRLAGVAAILLLMMASYGFWQKHRSVPSYHKNWVTYVHSGAENDIATFRLPDSSQVWLDKGTTLQYPSHFDGSLREVQVEGTAFFEVKKDPEHPFIVHTPGCLIKVLGTAFSVRSTAPDQNAETILMNGSVQLLHLSGQPLAQLLPGQQAVYSPDKETVDIQDVDAKTLTSWRFGLVTLSNVSAGEIVRTLEEAYSIRIAMDTLSLQGRLYNFTFKRTHTPETTLRGLSYITGQRARLATP